MTGILLALLGTALLILVSVDIFTTIIHMEGGGTLSKFFASNSWKCLFWLARGRAQSRLLNYAGGITLTYLVFSWIFMLWISYSLIFLADPGSVVETSTNKPTNALQKIYFVGYTLTSLGNGDLKPATDFWRIVTNLLGINTMFFVTLGITYLVPVLKAVVSKRSLAIYIHKMGQSPQEILLKGWNGEDFSQLYKRFDTLETMILRHSEHHLSYPVLHYFHSTLPKYSTPFNLASLDEAITIQEVYGIDQSADAYHWKIIRGAMDDYLDKLSGTFIHSASQAPSFPYPEFLPAYFIQDISQKEKENKLRELEGRRRKIKGLIEKDGWKWEDLAMPKGD